MASNPKKPPWAKQAEDALEGVFQFQQVRVTQKRRPNGGLDWHWRGPNSDREWPLMLNRLAWLPSLQKAWKESGDSRYLNLLTDTLADWLCQNPCPNFFMRSVAWRPLEVARRASESFLPLLAGSSPGGLSSLPAPWPETLRSSLRAHARFLRRHHAWRGNHLITEMLALLEVSLFFEDDSEAVKWADFAVRKLSRSLERQIYPDGSYKELSSHYHRIISRNVNRFCQLLEKRQEKAEQTYWQQKAEALWGYLHQVLKPNGKNPLNNDTDEEALSSVLALEAPAHIGKESRQTTHFPWAGHTVFRGEKEPHWGFFDSGPAGTDHAHEDFLSFTCSSGEADFLLDNGRYTYKPGSWRRYFAGPAGHNVIMVDGRGARQPGRERRSLPKKPAMVKTEEGHRAQGETFFTSAWSRKIADWRREVGFQTDLGWCIEDYLVLFGRREVTTLWHFHPHCQIKGKDEGAGVLWQVSHDDTVLEVRLRDPSGKVDWEIVKGQTYPLVQGWWSPKFNLKEPAPCLVLRQTVIKPFCNQWAFTFRG
ncbi:MAG: heparinase II/III family protein [Opitutales bacterium]|nr:heparinase II/III family protein [Opitutales bacterium]